MKTVRNIVLGGFAGLILVGFLLTATYVFLGHAAIFPATMR